MESSGARRCFFHVNFVRYQCNMKQLLYCCLFLMTPLVFYGQTCDCPTDSPYGSNNFHKVFTFSNHRSLVICGTNFEVKNYDAIYCVIAYSDEQKRNG